MRKDGLRIVSLKSFRSSKAVDVPAQPRVGERTKDQIPVVADVGRVSGHERDATARFDNCGSHGELVDPVQDARLTPADSCNHGESLLEREAFVYSDPCLVLKICRFDRGFRCKAVIASDRDIQRLVQERLHTHRPRP